MKCLCSFVKLFYTLHKKRFPPLHFTVCALNSAPLIAKNDFTLCTLVKFTFHSTPKGFPLYIQPTSMCKIIFLEATLLLYSLSAISGSKYQRPLKFKMGAARQIINSVQNSKSLENRKNRKIAKEIFEQKPCKKRGTFV